MKMNKTKRDFNKIIPLFDENEKIKKVHNKEAAIRKKEFLENNRQMKKEKKI